MGQENKPFTTEQLDRVEFLMRLWQHHPGATADQLRAYGVCSLDAELVTEVGRRVSEAWLEFGTALGHASGLFERAALSMRSFTVSAEMVKFMSGQGGDHAL